MPAEQHVAGCLSQLKHRVQHLPQVSKGFGVLLQRSELLTCWLAQALGHNAPTKFGSVKHLLAGTSAWAQCCCSELTNTIWLE